MSYKVTALKAVKFLANVRGEKTERIGADLVSRPTETKTWISLKANESRDGLGLIWGIDPRQLPDEAAMQHGGYQFVMLPAWLDGDLPKEFFGLLRLEISSTSSRA